MRASPVAAGELAFLEPGFYAERALVTRSWPPGAPHGTPVAPKWSRAGRQVVNRGETVVPMVLAFAATAIRNSLPGGFEA